MPTAAAPPTAAERRVVRGLLGMLAVAVAASSVLHHGAPGVLDVPPNDGVPRADPATLLFADGFAALLAWLCFRHARVALGLYRATLFLVGSFVFTGLEETLWILWGRWDPRLGGTYYFTKGFFWFLETPVSACLGWFFLAYASVHIAQILLPRAGTWAHATLGGLLATSLDLWVDPVQTHAAHRAWVWLSPTPVRILSIPLSNFVGWFLLIFLFALVFARRPVRPGSAGDAAGFFGTLVALEIAILVGFVAFGAALGALLPAPVNLTVLGI